MPTCSPRWRRNSPGGRRHGSRRLSGHDRRGTPRAPGGAGRVDRRAPCSLFVPRPDSKVLQYSELVAILEVQAAMRTPTAEATMTRGDRAKHLADRIERGEVVQVGGALMAQEVRAELERRGIAYTETLSSYGGIGRIIQARPPR